MKILKNTFAMGITAFALCLGVASGVLPGQAHAQDPYPAGVSLNDVWMQYGGARLYYMALVGARQTWAGGAIATDPASLPKLPPLKRWSGKIYYGGKSYSSKKAKTTKAAKAPQVAATPPAYTPLSKNSDKPQNGGDSLGALSPSSYGPGQKANTQAPAGSANQTTPSVSMPKPPVTPTQQLWPSSNNTISAPRSITPVTPPAAPGINATMGASTTNK